MSGAYVATLYSRNDEGLIDRDHIGGDRLVNRSNLTGHGWSSTRAEVAAYGFESHCGVSTSPGCSVVTAKS